MSGGLGIPPSGGARALTPSQINPKLEQAYAELTVNLLANVQEDQEVLIQADRMHGTLVEKVIEACNRRGARRIDLWYDNPHFDLERIKHEDLDSLATPDPLLKSLCDRVTLEGGAFIKIVGSDREGALLGADQDRVAALAKGNSLAQSGLRQAVQRGLINRAVIANSTPGWAALVYPELPQGEAQTVFQNTIYDMCCVSASDPEEAFKAQLEVLEEKRKWLQALELQQLRFIDNDTDLLVPLGKHHLWLGPSKTALNGVVHVANCPVGEVFTTPDYRGVSGHVAVSMPTIINGQAVEGLQIKFHPEHLGSPEKYLSFSADKGAEVFRALLARDRSAPYLGEIALVSMDTPVARANRVFREVLMDEKARCHGAFGQAYLTNILNGSKLTAEECHAIGVNFPSLVHHDFMISSGGTQVRGLSAQGHWVDILVDGVWAA